MGVWQIVAVVMTVMTIVAGARWRHFKVLVKELAEALTATSEVLEDDKITKAERHRIAEEWADVVAAGKKLLGSYSGYCY